MRRIVKAVILQSVGPVQADQKHGCSLSWNSLSWKQLIMDQQTMVRH